MSVAQEFVLVGGRATGLSLRHLHAKDVAHLHAGRKRLAMTVVPLRTFTIGGSDAAAAAGIDPHRSRVMLFLEKMGRVERPASEAMSWGKRLEPLVKNAVRAGGVEILEPISSAHEVVRDSERPWLVGHPDGYYQTDEAGNLGVLEVKTVGQWAKREWNGTPPLAYVAQCQHYLHLTGLDRALLAVLVGGQRLELTTIARDDGAIRRLLDLEEEFYGFLVRDELPAPDGSASAREALAALFPESTQRTVRLDKDGMRLYRELKARREQADAIDAQKMELENRLKAILGDAERAVSPHDEELIRWPSVESSRVDVKALREAHPEVAAEFVKVTQTRRFQAL